RPQRAAHDPSPCSFARPRSVGYSSIGRLASRVFAPGEAEAMIGPLPRPYAPARGKLRRAGGNTVDIKSKSPRMGDILKGGRARRLRAHEDNRWNGEFATAPPAPADARKPSSRHAHAGLPTLA